MRLLFAIAVLVSLPAVVVLVGVAFQDDRSRRLLAAYGPPLVLAGLVSWAACLAAQLYSGETAWALAGSLLGLALATSVAIARNRVTPTP